MTGHAAIPARPPWPQGTSSGHEDARGEPAPRQQVSYFCAGDHETPVTLAAGADHVPLERDCPRCGLPAGLDRENPPRPVSWEPYRTHLAYVKERRTEEEGAQILAEAQAELRQRRAAE